VRDESGPAAGVAVFLSARVTDVRAAQFRRLIKEERVIRLFVDKGLPPAFAGWGAGLMFHSFMGGEFLHEYPPLARMKSVLLNLHFCLPSGISLRNQNPSSS